MHLARRRLAAGKELAFDGAHAAFAALAGAAIVRDVDAVAKRRIEQHLVPPRPERFAVDAHPVA
jgi:hypothetical protein